MHVFLDWGLYIRPSRHWVPRWRNVTLLVEFRRPVSGVGLPCSCDAADFPCASVPRRVEKKAGERVDFEVFSGLNLEEP